MLKAIIFDCFNVIYSEYVDLFYTRHSELFNNSSEQLDELYKLIDLDEISQNTFYKKVGEMTNIPWQEVEIEMQSLRYYDPKIVKLIKSLRKKYKIGLLSNAGEEEISILFKEGLDQLFDSLTISCRVGNKKPDLKIYRVCLEDLGVLAEESVFVDDLPENLVSAEALGMRTVLYKKFGSPPKSLLEMA